MPSFKEDMLASIQAGRKTRTWRPLWPDEYFWVDAPPRQTIDTLRHNGRVKYRTGSTYAATPGRGKRAVCRIHLHKIELMTPNMATEQDAIEEGFNSVEEFHNKLRSIYGESFDLDTPGYSLVFTKA